MVTQTIYKLKKVKNTKNIESHLLPAEIVPV